MSKSQSSTQYNKLIRDFIPNIIHQDKKKYAVSVLGEKEFEQALRDKLIEEAKETATAPINDLVTEIADLYEVLDTLMKLHNIEEQTVREIQKQRRLKRGGFEQRLNLLWVEADIS